MSGIGDKAQGLANQAMGTVKQGVGKALGDKKMQAEGEAQELKGKGQKIMSDANEGLKNAADKKV